MYDYKVIASRKLEERNKNFFPEWIIDSSKLPGKEVKDVSCWIAESGELSEKEMLITESGVAKLIENIKNRTWTSVEITSAFCHRASICQQLLNCLSEVFFTAALEDARRLDEYFQKNETLKGPLHGIPVSIKDNFNVKGQATTVGIVNFCFQPEKFDDESSLVKMLRGMGAILYIKTNVPVAMMMPETTNHVYGTTLNPLNRDLSCGGSSGGEAALLALKGAPVGVGSDIGGSIRIPSAFNNVFGLRPSFGRFPTYGARSGLPGLESVNSVNGPISNDIFNLEEYCKAVISSEPWIYDAKVIQMPWREISLPSKLKIGILTDDGYVHPTPPILRGMNIIIEKLNQHGHELIDWEPTGHLRLSQLITQFFISDGGTHILRELKEVGEPLYPYMKNYGSSPDIPVSELWKLQAERTKMINEYLARWNETSRAGTTNTPMDAIIMPVSPHAGCVHGSFGNYVGYTSPFNALDYAAGVLPVTRADAEIDMPVDGIRYYNSEDESIQKNYNATLIHGGGVSVQVVCRKFEEEKVIALLKYLKGILEE